MKKLIIILIALLSFEVSIAQDFSNSISTQRPGLTEGAPALDAKIIQVEAGYLKFGNTNIVPTVFRYSPLKNFETRFTTTWQDNQHFIGLKYTLPFDFPIIFSVNTDIQLNGNFGLARIAAYYPLGEDAYLSANYGRYSKKGFAIVQLGYSFSSRVFGFIEGAYTVLIENTFQTNIGLGLAITPNLQIDSAFGFDTSNNIYFEIGSAFRIKHN